jgi:protein phosphatase 1 regulatory subunit 37
MANGPPETLTISDTLRETNQASASMSQSIGDDASGSKKSKQMTESGTYTQDVFLTKGNNADLPPTPAEPPASAGPSVENAPVSSLPPSIYKRKLKQKPKGILKPAPPPTKAFSFRRDILQQLNTRLAQQGVNVQVPVPQSSSSLGSLSETAQGTAQAAGSIIGGMFKRMSNFAAASIPEDGHTSEYANIRPPYSPVSNDAAERGREQAKRPSYQSSRGAEQADSSSPTRTNNLPVPSSSIRPLRKVRFTVSNMAVIYPISNTIAPGDEDATRLRVEKEHRLKLKNREPKHWTVAELEKLYRECCRTREEHPLKKMRSVFQEASQQTPPGLRSIDLSFITLDRLAIEPVADLLSVDFGLNKLVLENCGLTDEGLKSILHALLTSGSLPSLSLASNKKIKYYGWRYVGIFMRRAKALRYLDLSENNINKASLEHIAGAIAKQQSNTKKGKGDVTQASQGEDEEEEAPLMLQSELLREDQQEVSSLSSLRLENCGLRNNSLELLAQSVRMSDLNHLSLRRNRISQLGAVALAIMIKDYPDSYQSTIEQSTGLGELEQQQQHQPKVTPQSSQAQYTIRGNAARRSLSPELPNVPLVVSSPGGGVTRRSRPSLATDELLDGLVDPSSSGLASPNSKASQRLTDGDRDQVIQLKENGQRSEGEALSLFYAKRARKILSAMPRVGNLLTLDLKGNDIRGGIVYLSQALKKNRTLKVLNLSDNNIEMSGLVAIADALKYNATLETLDLSHNPCCGPGLEGITTLRNAFTLNLNLKRLFISDTDLSSEGAIALAEFLPEAKTLIHLDLTENLLIDIAGVMALAVSVRMNKSLRCLDLNIPPNAPDFARLSQEILNSCIRNTESAQRRAEKRGVKAPIAAPIYKSTLARAAKEKEERNRLIETNMQLEQAAKVGSEASQPEQNRKRVVDAARECCLVLQELLGREEDKVKELSKERGTKMEGIVQSELANDLLNQGRILRDKLQRALGVMGDGSKLEQALQVNDELEEVISKLQTLYSVPVILGGESEQGRSSPAALSVEADNSRLQAPLPASAPSPSSPTFSIGSDDDEEDEDDLSTRRSKAGKGDILAEREEVSNTEVEGQKAAREIPSDKEADESFDEHDEVSDKARGQLSEEGEIFRRARSLQVDDDDDEEVKDGISIHSGQEEESCVSAEDKDGTSIEAAEVSGEELRRELLETDVPRSTSLRSVIDEAEQQQLVESI